MADHGQLPLDAEERNGIVLAVQSAFVKLRNLYRDITPIFEGYGFAPPSAGVIARDLSEKIETSIVQHCSSFTKGKPPFDLCRDGRDWEVKICKDSGLTINQSKAVGNETYIVVNYKATSQVIRVWVLWSAKDELFSDRKSSSNARAMRMSLAESHMEVLYQAPKASADRLSIAQPAFDSAAFSRHRRRQR